MQAPKRPALQARFVTSHHVETFQHLFASADFVLLALFGLGNVVTASTGFSNNQITICLFLETAVSGIKVIILAQDNTRHAITHFLFKIFERE